MRPKWVFMFFILCYLHHCGRWSSQIFKAVGLTYMAVKQNNIHIWYTKEKPGEAGKKQKWKGGQSDTYLRQTRVSSGPRVSVAKTYRDETKWKCGLSARSQWPSSAVEYRRLNRNFSAAGASVEFGGLTDVETGGLSGMEDKLVCSFKLAVDVAWDGVR